MAIKRALRILANLVLGFLFRTFVSKSGRVPSLYAAHRVRQFDENLPDDVEDVLEASAVLEIREFDMFRLAYLSWFGKECRKDVLEVHFARYMFNKIVPHWVRHYSRMILERASAGVLDREALGVYRLPDATPRSIRAGVRYSVALACVMSVLVVIANLAHTYLELPCMFPPCY